MSVQLGLLIVSCITSYTIFWRIKKKKKKKRERERGREREREGEREREREDGEGTVKRTQYSKTLSVKFPPNIKIQVYR